MHVGIYLSEPNSSEGGAAIFENNVVNRLKKLASRFAIKLSTFSVKDSSDDANEFQNGISHRLFGLRVNSGSVSSHSRLVETRFSPLQKADLVNRINSWFVNAKIDFVYSPSPFLPIKQIPYFVTVWDLQHRRQPFFPEVSIAGHLWEDREQLYASVLPRAAGILVGTNVGKEEICHFYRVHSERVHVLPQPVPDDVTYYQRTLGGKQLKPRLPFRFAIYPAQFWPHKNHITLLKAWELLCRSPEFHLHLLLPGADHGNLKYVQRLVKEYGLTDKIHFPGFVTRQQLLHFYSTAEMLVFPSLFGPDNIPPLEAMTLGCPVVMSDIEGAAEQVGDAAIRVPPSDELSWASAISKLLTDHQMRTTLIMKGLELRDLNSTEKYVFGLIAHFQELAILRRNWSNSEPYLYGRTTSD